MPDHDLLPDAPPDEFPIATFRTGDAMVEVYGCGDCLYATIVTTEGGVVLSTRQMPAELAFPPLEAAFGNIYDYFFGSDNQMEV